MNLSKNEAETLVRLAATIIDEPNSAPDSVGGPVYNALSSFSEPEEVEALARRVATALYVNGEDLEIS